jgi:hypothetical protein
MFTVLGICFLIGLHRSRAVEAKPRIVQIGAYVSLAILSFFGLSKVNEIVQRRLSESNTSFARTVASFAGKSRADVATTATPPVSTTSNSAPVITPKSVGQETASVEEISHRAYLYPSITRILSLNVSTIPEEKPNCWVEYYLELTIVNRGDTPAEEKGFAFTESPSVNAGINGQLSPHTIGARGGSMTMNIITRIKFYDPKNIITHFECLDCVFDLECTVRYTDAFKKQHAEKSIVPIDNRLMPRELRGQVLAEARSLK